MNIEVGWSTLKEFVDERSLSIQWVDIDVKYLLCAMDGPFCLNSEIKKENPANSDQTDFENNYKTIGNKSPKSQVVTQYELDNKSLRTIAVFCQTNSSGIAKVSIKIPSNGRYVAYGDAEFEEKEFGDYISKIEVSDLDRLIAWQMALAQDPNATNPVDDSVVQANGYPLYPCLEHYDERTIETSSNTAGTIVGGMTMNFQGQPSEAQPVGGYAFLPGDMYFIIECKKVTAVANKKCQISLDMAEANE